MQSAMSSGEGLGMSNPATPYCLLAIVGFNNKKY
jgi:hypothetical protein